MQGQGHRWDQVFPANLSDAKLLEKIAAKLAESKE